MDKAQDVAPEWAWKRLRELKAEVGTSIINPTEVAFARYIASKEEAPDDQGRDALEEIVQLAIQLGIEQGRRIARSDESELLDNANGAVFTLTVGWGDRTHLHTQAGILTDPAECLRKAIKAFEDELSRVERCPRERALRNNPLPASVGGRL